MLLQKRGQETHFDPRLLKNLIIEKNDEVVSTLQRYRGYNTSPEWGQLTDSSEATLLHHAADYGNSEITKYLLNDGKCEIDAQDALGRTPLMLAVNNEEHEGVLEVLLKANADINVTDNQGKNALQLIFELGPKCSRILGKFFQHAPWEKIIEGIALEELAKKFDEIGITSKDAFLWRHAELMKMLLGRENENTINTRDQGNGKTMLHVAVQQKMIKMVNVLIDFGADVNILDDWNATPLFYLYDRSCDKDSAEFLEMLKILVSRATLLTSCADQGCMQISNALLFGTNEAIEIVLQAIIDLNVTDEEGDTVLHYLAKNGNADLFKLMHGRNFDVNASNNEGCTAFHVAAELGSWETVKFCLEDGADVNKANNVGKTPLDLVFHRAVELENKTVELLLQYGADSQVCLQHHGDLDWTMLNFVRDLFDESYRSRLKSLAEAKPILARLAIDRELGLEITDQTRSKINLKLSWLAFFDKCQRQVKIMKETTVYGDLSLFDFLTESRRKASAHARNEELISELKKAIQGFEVDSPYPDLLRNRLVKATKLADLREKAINVISRMINLEMNAYYFAVECIVDYLSNRDMEMLLLV